MARNLFGGTADSVAEDATGARIAGAVGTVWDGPTLGATQLTDLTDESGVPITGLTADSVGYVSAFYGPDGYERVWVDFGAGKVGLVSVTVGERLDSHITGADPHGDRAYADALFIRKTSLRWFDVVDYGATGNGTSVDSAAIQAAVNDAAAAGGGTVFIPAGTYLCSNVYLASNVTLQGAGMGATVLKLDPTVVPGTNALVLRVANGSTVAASYVTVRDLTIDGNKAAFPNPAGKIYGYYLGTSTSGLVTDCVVDGVEFRGCATYACDVVNAVRVTISNCFSHDNGGTLGSYNNSAGFEILGDDITLIGCRAVNNANKGFISGESTTVHYRTRFIGCTAQANTSDGFFLHSGLNNSSIIGCISRENGGNGITLAVNATKNVISASTASGNTGNGIRLDTATYNTVTACICDGNSATSPTSPEIYLTNASHNTVAECQVNSFNAPTSIVEQGTSDYNAFRDNTYNKAFTMVGVNSTSFSANAKAYVDAQVTPGAWIPYTPVWTASTTAPSLGSGVLGGRYSRAGKMCTFSIWLAAGTDTTWGTGSYAFSLPFAANTAMSSFQQFPGVAGTSLGRFPVFAQMVSAGSSTINVWSTASATNTALTQFGSSNIPGAGAWTSTSYIRITGTYEVA